ncbi:protein PHTF2-like isoform X2 [Lineus longissimus]|uniref:protein PHTF2-like isoform X2 n=1 Tax=Lineus longissimus TaxID=88925 RepID=UPI00315DF7B4
MEKITRTVDWYQKKIGTYDKQLWERSVEQKIIKGIHGMRNVPKKSGKVKAEFIDVDLVRGSAFTKAKPQCSAFTIARKGLIRMFLLPFFYKWWRDQTSFRFWLLMILLYVLHLSTLVLYFTLESGEPERQQMVRTSDVITPLMLLIILGIMHSQIVSTHSNRKAQREEERLRKRAERSKRRKSRPYSTTQSEHESGSQENNGDIVVLEDGKETSLLRKTLRNEGVKVLSTREQNDRLKINQEQHDKLKIGFAKTRTGDRQSPERNNSEKVAERSPLIVVKDVSNNRSEKAGETRMNGVVELKSETVKSRRPCGCKSSEIQWCRCDEDVENVEYKSLDGTDDVTWNTQEDLNSLSMPLESVGEIIMPKDGKYFDDSLELQNLDTVVGAAGNHGNTSSPGASLSDEDSSLNCSNGQKSHSKTERLDFAAERSDLSSSCEVEVKNDSSIEADRLLNDMADAESGASGGEADAPPKIRITNSQDQDVRSDSSSNKRRYGSGQTVRRRRRSNLKVNINSEKSSGSKRKHDTLSGKNRDPKESTAASSCESEADTVPNTPTSSRKASHKCNLSQLLNVRLHQTKLESSNSSDGPMSEAEWDRMNSDMATSDTSSCTSGSELSEDEKETSSHDDPFYWSNIGQTSDTVVHNSHTPAHDKVSCYIWEGDECKKVDLTVLDIGWIIIEKVDKIPETADYLFLGAIFSFLLAFTPALFRLYHQFEFGYFDLENYEMLSKLGFLMFGKSWVSNVIMANGALQRICLSCMLFFLLSVAERTFKQRLWYAKHFCYLTSSRRARKYDLPHFRLNKVRNIKTWLSLRSYLKKRGPQRSVDVIVSAAFLLAVTLVALMCVQLLKDTESFLDQIYNWELGVWSLTLGIFLLRFMTLGNKINKKYKNLSVLITEQINLYLHMEQKPHKKEELMLANNVLKLAEALLKELESPFKISGLAANPFLYNITKVVILSAFSAVLTEMLGFKLKLYKIKLKP